MKTTALLLLSILAGGCAATASTAPAAPADPRVPARSDSWSLEEAALTPAPLTASLQQAASTPAPDSPHSFNAGFGIRVRDGESAFDLTGEYHYRVSDALDVGAIADWAWSPIDSLLIAPAAWLHPDDRLTLFAAPGIEFISGKGGEGALRLGGSYLIPFGRIALRPFGWYDFVTDRKNSFSLGVAIGV